MKVVSVGVIAMLAAFGLMMPSAAQNAQAEVRIFLAGDSTVSNYKPEAPQRGWGQVLDRYFNKNVTIVNLAASGASTKTFRSIGRWDKLLAQLKPGDYVMCQFGHNDSSRDKVKAKGTDAGTEYQANLKKFIEEVKSKGAAIILVTPMHRGTFQADGKITQDLLPYVEAMRKVAKENNITLIDIYTPSGEYLEKIGPDDIAPIFCGIKNDKTHFSEKGALVMAEFVVKGIAVAKHPLTEYLKQQDNAIIKKLER